ncbi:Protein EARLY-RESPONSIVE TO DEHYDRATION 7 like [Actinidia chinensis var. chinensis]|uniref:Protein EARLY-RESPONSIVE TO DEHYDRATION 7 like n=1 Tax=Actinidia chinensis var. chinensis TaxID=1590841 RepID=A0A2R6R6X7_ACTCC|nr:Protein EARLY-RESPONSIVE TO DEHYDRATION 7 like [Actinidia chinensis var. chinensis]
MSSQIPKNSLYPQIDESNPEAITSSFSPSSSSIYPSVDVKDLAENLFPENESQQNPNSQTLESAEEVLVRVPGTIVHLIDKQQSIELASGELTVVRLRQGDNVVVVLARVGDEIQWPLAKDEAAVKLDESHYFFSLRVPAEARSEDENNNGEDFDAENLLNYGVTIASKGQEGVLEALDGVLKHYSAFSEERVSKVVDGSDVPRQTSPEEMETEEKNMVVEGVAAAYWTTLAPNVEDYSGGPARMIAAGSGQLIKGILWCGDVTADRLRWGNEFLKKRLGSGSNTEISPQAMKRMKRVKKLTKMSDKVATGILLGVVKVSGFFTSSIVNSTVGKKFFSLLPGEIVLASLDGFNKVCDAVEVAGRNVMSTTSVVTTGLVSQRYGEQARKVTHEGLGAAGHAIGTAWAVFKIRKALNPKSVIKPTTLAKAAAQANSAELKTKNRK